MIVIFDLDGTLTNSEEGITKSVQYALRHYGIEEDISRLRRFIGPPLSRSFMKFYSFSERQAKEAVSVYREYYSEKGIFENKVYPGIPELLASLRSKGIRLAVGSSKPEVYVRKILDHFDLEQYFDLIVGSNLDETMTDKKEIIEKVIHELGRDEKTIMVGDRIFDRNGAEQTGVKFIGVTYGFAGPYEFDGVAHTAADTKELEETILTM